MTERGRVSYSHSNDPEPGGRQRRSDASARQGRRRRSNPGAAPRAVPPPQPSQTGDMSRGSSQAQPPGRPPQGAGPAPRDTVRPPQGAGSDPRDTVRPPQGAGPAPRDTVRSPQ